MKLTPRTIAKVNNRVMELKREIKNYCDYMIEHKKDQDTMIKNLFIKHELEILALCRLEDKRYYYSVIEYITYCITQDESILIS